MINIDDLVDTDSREKERTLGIYLMLPTFFLIVLPMFYFVAMSVYFGRDEFGPLREIINHYHVALFVVAIPCMGALAASLYLIVIKDIVDEFGGYRRY